MNVTCEECERVFDLFDETDQNEWTYGHDCEDRYDNEGERMENYWQLVLQYEGVTSDSGEVISLPSWQFQRKDGRKVCGPFHDKQHALNWANSRWDFIDQITWVTREDDPIRLFYGMPAPTI